MFSDFFELVFPRATFQADRCRRRNLKEELHYAKEKEAMGADDTMITQEEPPIFYDPCQRKRTIERTTHIMRSTEFMMSCCILLNLIQHSHYSIDVFLFFFPASGIVVILLGSRSSSICCRTIKPLTCFKMSFGRTPFAKHERNMVTEYARR